jgi:hypothetical protein
MPKLRTVLICMLMLTMPLQAMASMSMQLSAAKQPDSPAQSVAAVAGECHGQADAGQSSVNHASCSHCTACMSAAAIGRPLSAGGSLPLTQDPPLRQPVAFSFIPDTPERPPRLFLA